MFEIRLHNPGIVPSLGVRQRLPGAVWLSCWWGGGAGLAGGALGSDRAPHWGVRVGVRVGVRCGAPSRRLRRWPHFKALRPSSSYRHFLPMGEVLHVCIFTPRACVAKSEETSDGSSQLSGPPRPPCPPPRAGVSPARSLSPRRFALSPSAPRNVVSKCTDGSFANTYENFSKARKASRSGPPALACNVEIPLRFVTSAWQRNSALIPVPH